MVNYLPYLSSPKVLTNPPWSRNRARLPSSSAALTAGLFGLSPPPGCQPGATRYLVPNLAAAPSPLFIRSAGGWVPASRPRGQWPAGQELQAAACRPTPAAPGCRWAPVRCHDRSPRQPREATLARTCGCPPACGISSRLERRCDGWGLLGGQGIVWARGKQRRTAVPGGRSRGTSSVPGAEQKLRTLGASCTAQHPVLYR